MILLPIRDVRKGDVLARGIANPDNPHENLLKRRAQIDDRLRHAFEQIGVRALWIDSPGQLACESALAEESDYSGRNLAAAFKRAFDSFATGDAKPPSLGSLRDNLIAFTDALERHDRILVEVDHLTDRGGGFMHHSLSVCRLSLLVALELGSDFPEPPGAGSKLQTGQRLLPLGLGALLHDVGKLRLAESLRARARWELSGAEMDTVQNHTREGHTILLPHCGPVPANIALCHHLFTDGKGYPSDFCAVLRDAEQEENVHPFARVVAVAEAYEELVGRRNYLPIEALEELNCARRHQFDARILAALNRVAPPFPIGGSVQLATGHFGVVAQFHPEQPFCPDVQLLQDPQGNPLAEKQRVLLKLADYPQARLRRCYGRPIAHLLPDDSTKTWEEMQ